MKFITFRNTITAQFEEMQKYPLYVMDTDKETLWNLYLDSFAPKDNPIFRERTKHDCQCCKSFIRSIGNVVAIDTTGKIMSIWDITTCDIYQPVADALASYVKAQQIRNILLKAERQIGIESNHGISPSDEVETWNHFFLVLPDQYVVSSDIIGTKLAESQASHDVFKRGLETISLEAIDITLDLINQNSIYRGEEFQAAILSFREFLKYSEMIPIELLDIYVWKHHFASGARIRNTMIGTLLVDISKGLDLETSVAKYESKAAPENYKRPKALITKRMISDAQKTVADLGLQDSLSRQFATINDLTINNVLFADNSVKQALDVFDQLANDVPNNIKTLDHVEEITISDFMQNVLPTVDKIELLFKPQHTGNLVSLIGPQDVTAPSITKWDNNFGWSYNGEVADSSIKNKVKSLGGGVVGPLRFSINWAEGDWSADNSDLDAWAREPNKVKIGFSTPYVKNKNHRSPCSGQLDIDIITPSSHQNMNVVENIIWTDQEQMINGTYLLVVNQYNASNSKGFKAEVEVSGVIYSYLYDKPVSGDVNVATVTLKDGEFTIKHYLPTADTVAQDYWNITTNNFHVVKTLMHSPNHWNDQGVGNRHYFFMLEDCLNPDSVRGFYNEFLPESLTKHRKVFEVLGSKMRAEHSDTQLSGLGFSTTKKDSVICKVSGSFSRMLKIIF